MTIKEFLDLLIGEEYTYVIVKEPRSCKELTRMYADDLLHENPQFIHSWKVCSFYIIEDDLFINARPKDE